MMRQAFLVGKAASLMRRVYASLPWGLRVANLLAVLAASDPRADFGRLVYTIFLRHKVEGMPDIGGKDALTVDVSGKKLAPPGYGKDFGNRLWSKMLSKYRDPELISEAMQTLAMKLLSQSGDYFDGIPLRKAEGHVLYMLDFGIQDLLKSAHYRHMRDTGSDSDDDREFQILDRETLRKLDDVILPNEMHRIKQRLVREVHPDAALYIDLLLEGYDAKEIVGDVRSGLPSMLPHVQQKPMSYQNWDGNIKPKIYRIFREELTS